MNLNHPLTEEEKQKSRAVHHVLGDAPCRDVTFVRCYWKGQPVTVVALIDDCDCEDGPHEGLLPLAVVITDEIDEQLMPYWVLEDGDG